VGSLFVLLPVLQRQRYARRVAQVVSTCLRSGSAKTQWNAAYSLRCVLADDAALGSSECAAAIAVAARTLVEMTRTAENYKVVVCVLCVCVCVCVCVCACVRVCVCV
jgi:hypothetical protein